MKAVVFFNKYINKFVNYIVSIMIICCLLFCCSCQSSNKFNEKIDMSPRKIALNGDMLTTQVVGEVKNAVVGISCKLIKGYSVGTGVAVYKDGYILTNNHVIDGAREITLYFADKTSENAGIIWKDSSIDLALIKTKRNMPYLECGDAYKVKQGEDIIAIGTPLSLDFKHTVTKGIVSAVDRTLKVQGVNGTVNYMQNLIQHDASINPGNSGGPLINLKGEVVGINTLKAVEGEGIGFAIPINIGKSVVKNITENPYWKPAYMGVFGSSIDAFKHNLKNYKNTKGLYVKNIDKNVENKLGGIKKGDIIIEIDDKKIYNMLDLRLALYDYKCDDVVSVKIIRNNKTITLKSTLCKRP